MSGYLFVCLYLGGCAPLPPPPPAELVALRRAVPMACPAPAPLAVATGQRTQARGARRARCRPARYYVFVVGGGYERWEEVDALGYVEHPLGEVWRGP